MPPRGFRPGGVVGGELRVPRSKSIAQRALLCAGFAAGRTVLVTGGLEPDDTRRLREALEGLGIAFVQGRFGEFAVTGCPPAGPKVWRSEGDVQVGESGTAARFLTAAIAFGTPAGQRFRIAGSGTLTHRRSLPLFRALRQAGAVIESEGAEGSWPAHVTAASPPRVLRLEAPVSSQEVSALLLALAAFSEPRELRVGGEIPSRPYVNLTLDVLKRFGADVEGVGGAHGGENAETFRVAGPLVAPKEPFVVEPDASSAAVALAAACLTGGHGLVTGLGERSAQGDVRIIAHLHALGCEARATAEELDAQGFPARGAELDLSGEPDLAPVLAALCGAVALAGKGNSRLTGLGTLPVKESERIEVLASGLSALGCAIDAGADFLTIRRGAGSLADRNPLRLETSGDHRMVFAFALLSLVREGIEVTEPECVAKSWPGFWEDLGESGARG